MTKYKENHSSAVSHDSHFANAAKSDQIQEPDISIPAARSAKKLYALIVGICDYREDILLANNGVYFSKLSGCVNDAVKVKSYLENILDIAPEIVLLTDEQATRENIISQLKQHLGKAKTEDSLLFYFSGHGTQQFVDKKVFTSEHDGLSEAIVCYYDDNDLSGALLCDKEIRWLISRLGKKAANLLCIFDCCHSSGISRNAALVESSFKDVRCKRIPYVFAARPYHEYIFSGEVPLELLIERGENSALGNPVYVELSACESNESALEIAGEGVFTKALLEVLQLSFGSISYLDLISHVRQYMLGIYEQKPKLYAVHNSPPYFLGLSKGANNIELAELVYNSNLGWTLNRGALHGLKEGTLISVFPLSDPKRILQARVTGVLLDSSVLFVNGQPAHGERHAARIDATITSNIRLFVAPNNAPMATMQILLSALSGKRGAGWTLTEQEENADFCLRFLGGLFFLSYPKDPFRPIAITIDQLDPHLCERLMVQLTQINKWWLLRQLVNTQLPAKFDSSLLIEIDINQSGFKSFNGLEQVITYLQNGNRFEAQIRIRLTNNGPDPLYCAAIFLSAQFSVFTEALQPAVQMLAPGDHLELGNNGVGPINVYVEEAMLWYNIPFTQEFFRFVVSPTPFEVGLLDLQGIDPPDIPNKNRGISLSGHMGISVIPDQKIDKHWYTILVPFKLLNPRYNTISDRDLEAMLNDERTADFALGIYFDALLTVDLDTSYSLKTDINLKAEKGLLGKGVLSVANWWARNSRNKLYHRNIKNFPAQIRIVSEGDSWFQHPLVFDIIDHLSRIYPIFCTAAAGDTFRNMVSGEHRQGEYYLVAIEAVKPAIFLLSGGGNDILGSQFQGFLSDKPDHSSPEGENPSRFLKDSLLKEINGVMEIYTGVLDLLKTNYPELKVILHGYDYPVKLNDHRKGWLGRYMIAKGIDRVADRHAIIKYIMDEFNVMLKRTAAKYDNAIYLDLRNIVRYDPTQGEDQWYDEIHPNSEGFQQIAMHYITAINRIVEEKVN